MLRRTLLSPASLPETCKRPEGMQSAGTLISQESLPAGQELQRERLLSDQRKEALSWFPALSIPHFPYLSMHYIGIQFLNHILLRQVLLAVPKQREKTDNYLRHQ